MSWTDDDLIGLRIKGSASERKDRNVSRGVQPAQHVEPDPRVKRPKLPPTAAVRVSQFRSLCLARGLPSPVGEHRFHATRKWRFDYAFINERIALEVEGGAFTNGRHTRGAGFLKDIEKYGEAAALGWVVIRVVPKQLTDVRTFEWIRRAIDAREKAA
jgi:hypothetical protein